MITSKAALTAYIRSQLGEPTISVEVSNQQISEVIDETVQLYTEVVFGDFEEPVVIDGFDDKKRQIRLTHYRNVLQVQDQNGKEVAFHWSNIQRALTITALDVPANSKLMVAGLTNYHQNDEDDYIFGEMWVRQMAKAKTKVLWGNIVGKFSQSLVGGATINYDRLISEGESEIEKLMEELHDKWVDPAPVLVY